MLVGNLNGPARLLVNQIGNSRRWVWLSLVGADGRPVLGATAESPQIRVRWPGRGTDVWNAMPLERWATLREGEGESR